VLDNGMGITVQVVERFSDAEYQVAINSGAMDKTGHIAGKLEGHNVKIATDFATKKTVDHEMEHLLEKAGIITRRDQFIIDTKIKGYARDGKLGFDLHEDARENRADFLSQVLSDRSIDRNTPLGRIIQKVMDFLDSIGVVVKNTFTGRDDKSVRQIARGMESGSIYSKKGLESQQDKGQYGTLRNIDTKKKEAQYSITSDIKSRFQNKKKHPGYESETFKNILPPDAAKQMEANRGVKKATLLDRLMEIAGTIAHERHHFSELMKDPDTSSRSFNKEKLRHQQDVAQNSADFAKRKITNFIRGLDRAGMDMYAMNIIMGDMVRMADEGLISDGKIPNGFKTVDELKDTYKKLQDATKKNSSVARALTIRKSFQREIANDLVKYGILPKQVLKSDEYFHHQVLKYMNEKKEKVAAGSTEVRNKWRGWMKSRIANAEEYNTEYLEAEFVVMAQQISQVKTAENLAAIEKENNISSDLKAQAKAWNLKEIYKRASIDPTTKEKIDPLKAEKKKITIGFTRLAKMLESQSLTYDQEYSGLVQTLYKSISNTPRGESPVIEHPQLFPFLSHLIDKGHTGADAAAMIYKGIKERDRIIKDTLGDDFKTHRNFMPDTHTEWKPKPNNGWFWTGSIAEKVLDDVLAGVRSLQEKDVRMVLARGKDTTWVIPKGLAAQMDNLRPKMADHTMLESTSAKILGRWKQWILINPLSAIRYNVNNMSGDLDAVLAYEPRIAKGMKRSLSDLITWRSSKETGSSLTKELTEAQTMGVVGSGFVVQEVQDIVDEMGNDPFIRDILMGEKPNLARQFWEKTKKATAIREDILRLSAYRWFKQELSAGRRDIYGASKPQDIRNLTDKGEIDMAAAKLARELLGDYGNISSTGEYLRRRMIPFYSWIEINLSRYAQMMRNLKEEGGSTDRLTFMFAKKSAVFAAKASFLMGAVMLWNATMFPDEEEDMGESGRRQLHLILGRRNDGSIISVRFQGALSDALSWFGAEDLPSDIADMTSGKATIQDKLADIPKAWLNKGVNSLRPEPKLLFETLTGKSTYPDATAPRPIRDKVENVLRTFKLDKPYNYAMGKPKRGGDVMGQIASDLANLVTYTTEPGVQAYYDTRKMVFDWKKEHGLESGSGTPTKKGNALYYYKQAMKYGDIPAAKRYLQKYADLGGTYEGLQSSIKLAHPLSGIKKELRYEFKHSLSPAEVERVRKGLDWYDKTYRP
jgi:hypothetical protein